MRTIGGWKVLVSNSQMTDGEKKFLLSLKTKLLGVEFTRNEEWPSSNYQTFLRYFGK
jgi:hypothetical protein